MLPNSFNKPPGFVSLLSARMVTFSCIHNFACRAQYPRASKHAFLQDWLEQYEDVKFQDLRGADAHKIMLFVGIMAAHAIGEGSGVGTTCTLNLSPVTCVFMACCEQGLGLHS